MKTLPILIILIMALNFSFGQKKIKISEENAKIADGNNNALTITIYEADDKDVEKGWKKVMKKYNAKVKTKKEIFADDAEIKEMSDNTIDVTAKIEENKDGSLKFFVAFNLGGTFLNSSEHKAMFKEAKKIVYDFAVDITKEALKEELKDQEKILKNLEKEQEDLVSTKEGLEKDIEKWKEDIEKAKKEIEQNIKDQEAKKKEIEAQQKVVEEVVAKEKAVK